MRLSRLAPPVVPWQINGITVGLGVWESLTETTQNLMSADSECVCYRKKSFITFRE